MSFDKKALGSFVKDFGRAFIPGPTREEQPKPAKRPQEGIWKGRSPFLKKKDVLRILVKKGNNKKLIIGEDKKKINLNPQQVEEQVDIFFGDKNRLNRKEVLRRISQVRRDARLQRQRNILPSKALETREFEKLASAMMPGQVDMSPKTPGIGAEVVHGLGNVVRMARGKEVTSLSDKSVDSSTINKNIGEIKK